MGSPAARARLARDARPCATSLTDAEWTPVAPLLPSAAGTGRPRRWPMRRSIDAILYVLRTGRAWRRLPQEFPPWQTVHRWFLRLAHAGAFERLAHECTLTDRERVGRDASPTAGVVDAQAVRSSGTGVAGARGFVVKRKIVSERFGARNYAGTTRLINLGTDAGFLDSIDLHGAALIMLMMSRATVDERYVFEGIAQAVPSIVDAPAADMTRSQG
ncbi:MAG: transposase [Geminicoccaceae bacterium]|nr:transposase [Geminicoccaceae bacterium]